MAWKGWLETAWLKAITGENQNNSFHVYVFIEFRPFSILVRIAFSNYN